jgi:hypothetical protein
VSACRADPNYDDRGEMVVSLKPCHVRDGGRTEHRRMYNLGETKKASAMHLRLLFHRAKTSRQGIVIGWN